MFFLHQTTQCFPSQTVILERRANRLSALRTRPRRMTHVPGSCSHVSAPCVHAWHEQLGEAIVNLGLTRLSFTGRRPCPPLPALHPSPHPYWLCLGRLSKQTLPHYLKQHTAPAHAHVYHVGALGTLQSSRLRHMSHLVHSACTPRSCGVGGCKLLSRRVQSR